MLFKKATNLTEHNVLFNMKIVCNYIIMDTGQNVRYFQVEKCGFKTAKPQNRKEKKMRF